MRRRTQSLKTDSDLQSRLDLILQNARKIEEQSGPLYIEGSIRELAHLVAYLTIIVHKHFHDNER
jgi:hypothetical protein